MFSVAERRLDEFCLFNITFRDFHRNFEFLEPLEFDFGKISQNGLREMIFFSLQENLKGNLKGLYVVKSF